MNDDTAVLAWHFARDDGRQAYGDRSLIEPGGTETVTGTPELCVWGLHAAVRPLDALRYAKGALIRRVRLSGTVVHGDDKVAATERTELWRADATRALHEFTIGCAQRALRREREAGREPDPRSWAVLEAARQYLAGECDRDGLLNARDAAAAAYDAADAADAAYAAYAAAYAGDAADAADAAAAYAADAAAYACGAAGYAARRRRESAGAARARESAEQNAELERRLLALAPREVTA